MSANVEALHRDQIGGMSLEQHKALFHFSKYIITAKTTRRLLRHEIAKNASPKQPTYVGTQTSLILCSISAEGLHS